MAWTVMPSIELSSSPSTAPSGVRHGQDMVPTIETPDSWKFRSPTNTNLYFLLQTPTGSGVPCPQGKAKCCFKSRRDLKQFQDVCTPVGQNCPEPPHHFDDKYMMTAHPMKAGKDCTEGTSKCRYVKKVDG